MLRAPCIINTKHCWRLQLFQTPTEGRTALQKTHDDSAHIMRLQLHMLGALQMLHDSALQLLNFKSTTDTSMYTKLGIFPRRLNEVYFNYIGLIS